MSHASGFIVKIFAAIALGGLTAFLLHPLFKTNYSEFTSDEDKILAFCQREWGVHMEFSNAIERKLQAEMPAPRKFLVVKHGDTQEATYGFQYFGLDDTHGYLLLYTIELRQLVEKRYALAQAEQIFDELTEGQSKDISSFNDIYGPHLPCDFMKIGYPSGSIQAHFIGYAPDPATFALASETEAKHTGLRVLNNITEFFYAIENQALNKMSDEERSEFIIYGGDMGSDAFLQHAKRGFEDVFFELPN